MANPYRPFTLLCYLRGLPSVSAVSHGTNADGHWWVQVDIDINHKLADEVVKVLNHVIYDGEVRLPCLFTPVLDTSPFMFQLDSWIIESYHNLFTPEILTEWLKCRMRWSMERQ